MLKTIKYFLLLFMLILSLAISGCAAKEEPDIDALLAPYQEVLDRLNEENGWTLAIPEEAQEKVYNAYKDCTPEEFGERVQQEYHQAREDVANPGEPPAMTLPGVTDDASVVEFPFTVAREGITSGGR